MKCMGVDFNKPITGCNTPFDLGGGSKICVSVGTDGTWHGYEYNNFGSIVPNTLSDGTLIHTTKWDSDGNFVFAFGDSGDTYLTDIDYLTVKFKSQELLLFWDSDVNQYVGVDVDLSEQLLNENEVCFNLYSTEALIVDYTYEEVVTV